MSFKRLRGAMSTKLYTNSLMATLNSRAAIFQSGDGHISTIIIASPNIDIATSTPGSGSGPNSAVSVSGLEGSTSGRGSRCGPSESELVHMDVFSKGCTL